MKIRVNEGRNKVAIQTERGARAGMSLKATTVGVERCDELPVVCLSGRCDGDTVPEIERFLRRTFGPFFFRRHLILDLAQVAVVDDGFIEFTVWLARRLHAEHRELLLTRPVGPVRSLVAAVGLPNVIPVYDSLDEGINALASVSGALIPPRLDPRSPSHDRPVNAGSRLDA